MDITSDIGKGPPSKASYIKNWSSVAFLKIKLSDFFLDIILSPSNNKVEGREAFKISPTLHI